MPEYRNYTDSNGVRWTMLNTDRVMSAFVADDEVRRYIPDPPDIEPVGMPHEGTEAAQAEAERARFVMVRNKIEEYAKNHKLNVGLQVTESPPGGGLGWLALGLLLLLAAED